MKELQGLILESSQPLEWPVIVSGWAVGGFAAGIGKNCTIVYDHRIWQIMSN